MINKFQARIESLNQSISKAEKEQKANVRYDGVEHSVTELKEYLKKTKNNLKTVKKARDDLKSDYSKLKMQKERLKERKRINELTLE